jgi:hypothetical protein
MPDATKTIWFWAGRRVLLLSDAALIFGCGTAARLPVSAGMGPHPELPPPSTSLIPVVNVVRPRAGRMAGLQ